MAASSFEWEASWKCCWSIESSCYHSSPLFDVIYDVGVLSAVWLHQGSWSWNSHKIYVHHGSRKVASDGNFCWYNSSICETLVRCRSLSNTWAPSSLGAKILCSICFWFTCYSCGHRQWYGLWLVYLSYITQLKYVFFWDLKTELSFKKYSWCSSLPWWVQSWLGSDEFLSRHFEANPWRGACMVPSVEKSQWRLQWSYV